MSDRGKIHMEENVVSVALNRLETAGYQAYLVGGIVRDRVLERMSEINAGKGCADPECVDIGDIDIATSALPEQVKAVFCDMTVIETGIKHGTVTVLLRGGSDTGDNGNAYSREDCSRSGIDCGGKPGDGRSSGGSRVPSETLLVEITTYRTDGSYSDGRHPDSVSFAPSLEEDLKRRDFTINAMAQDRVGNIVDYHGGMSDLENRIVRTVGDPHERFNEDALRIMRALRFASILDFDIEKETEEALFSSMDMLKMISAERIFSEFKKLLTGKAAGRVVRKYADILGVVIPELSRMKGFQQHNEYHRYDVLEHCIRAMEAVRAEKDELTAMKMAALFHDIGKPATYCPDDTGRGHFYGHAKMGCILTEEIMKRFKADKALTMRVCTLVKYHDLIFENDERLLKRWMNRFTPKVLFEILEIKRADNLATGNMPPELLDKFDAIKRTMKSIVDEAECFSLKDLAVKGGDIAALGVEKGPEIGRILNILLEAVIDEKVSNEREALLELARAQKVNQTMIT